MYNYKKELYLYHNQKLKTMQKPNLDTVEGIAEMLMERIIASAKVDNLESQNFKDMLLSGLNCAKSIGSLENAKSL